MSGEIYRLLVQKNVTIKLPPSVPSAVSRQFTALIPGVIIILFFLIVRAIFAATPWASFPEFVAVVISAPLRGAGTSYIGTLIGCIFEHILWALGLWMSATAPIFRSAPVSMILSLQPLLLTLMEIPWQIYRTYQGARIYFS